MKELKIFVLSVIMIIAIAGCNQKTNNSVTEDNSTANTVKVSEEDSQDLTETAGVEETTVDDESTKEATAEAEADNTEETTTEEDAENKEDAAVEEVEAEVTEAVEITEENTTGQEGETVTKAAEQPTPTATNTPKPTEAAKATATPKPTEAAKTTEESKKESATPTATPKSTEAAKTTEKSKAEESKTTEAVSYDPEVVVSKSIALCQAGGMITTTDDLDDMLAQGKITQEEYEEYYPYDGLGYYSVFVETDLNQASTISGRKLKTVDGIADYIAGMMLLETDPVFNIGYEGIYTYHGTDYYEFRCYR